MKFLDPVETKHLQMSDVKQLKETIFQTMWDYYKAHQ
jgi:hypothetical protein